jgi:hypothetical protein
MSDLSDFAEGVSLDPVTRRQYGVSTRSPMHFDARALASMQPILSVRTSPFSVQAAIGSEAPGEWAAIGSSDPCAWAAPSELRWHRIQLVSRPRAA